MSNRATGSSPGRVGAAQTSTRQPARPRVDGWGAVRVESVDVRIVDAPDVAGVADVADAAGAAERRLVRARVHLGRLCPADVHVHVVPARTPADASAGPPLARLWSVQSYGNGTYVFETHLPATAPSRALRVQVARREDVRDDAGSAPPIARSRAVAGRGRRATP